MQGIAGPTTVILSAPHATGLPLWAAWSMLLLNLVGLIALLGFLLYEYWDEHHS